MDPSAIQVVDDLDGAFSSCANSPLDIDAQIHRPRAELVAYRRGGKLQGVHRVTKNTAHVLEAARDARGSLVIKIVGREPINRVDVGRRSKCQSQEVLSAKCSFSQVDKRHDRLEEFEPILEKTTSCSRQARRSLRGRAALLLYGDVGHPKRGDDCRNGRKNLHPGSSSRPKQRAIFLSGSAPEEPCQEQGCGHGNSDSTPVAAHVQVLPEFGQHAITFGLVCIRWVARSPNVTGVRER